LRRLLQLARGDIDAAEVLRGVAAHKEPDLLSGELAGCGALAASQHLVAKINSSPGVCRTLVQER
jgi:hypothetical protein